jgi:hypothetical protein
MASLLQLFSGRTPDTLLCRDVKEALLPYEIEDVRDAVHIVTHCLKPDFTPVSVWVEMFEGGYLAGDGGAAFRRHKFKNPDGARSLLLPIAREFDVELAAHPVHGYQIQLFAPDMDRMRSAIVAVANAAAHGLRELSRLG